MKIIRKKVINKAIHILEQQITDQDTLEWLIEVIKENRNKLELSDYEYSDFDELEIEGE